MRNVNKSVLDDDHVGRLLLKLAVPAFIGTFVTTLYHIISTIFVGHYVGSLGIGGIAITQPIQSLSVAFGNLFAVGGASVISRAIGAGDRNRAERTLGNAITCVFIISVIIMTFGLSDTNFWLVAIGASEDILPYAYDFLRISLIGIFFQTMALTLSGLIVAEGNARVAMTGMILGAVLNIILDFIFVVSLGWGVKGAALGTLIAQIICLSYLSSHYFRSKSYLKFHVRNLSLKWGLIGSIFAIGVSIFIMNMATGLSALFLNRMLVLYGGGIAVSAYAIVGRLMGFAVLPSMAIGQGMQPIAGFNYGTKRYDRTLKVMKTAIYASLAIGTAIFIVLEAIPAQLAGMFVNDPEMIALAAHAIRYVFSTMILTCVTIIGIFVFQSLGKAKQSLIISLRSLMFMLPLVFILPRLFQLEGVFTAYPLTEFLAFIVALFMFIPLIKDLRRLNNAKEPAIKNEPVLNVSKE